MTRQRRTSRGAWFRQADDIGLQRRLIRTIAGHDELGEVLF